MTRDQRREQEYERMKTRLSEALARLEELRVFAVETAEWRSSIGGEVSEAKAQTHTLYANEIEHIIHRANT